MSSGFDRPYAGTWAVVPVKPFGQAKSRLAKTLSATARMELAESLMRHTLQVLRTCSELANVVVVSQDDRVLEIASELGAVALRERSQSNLNRAIMQALGYITSVGGKAGLVLPSDLPNLHQTDVAELLDCMDHTGSGIVICPDRHEQGTNALLLSPPDLLNVAYGPQSFEAHVRAANALGIDAHVVRAPGIVLDLDTPDDWKLWHAQQPLFERRSVRRYSNALISRTAIERLVAAATWAPSAHNRQPWRFVVVTKESSKLELAQAMGDRLRSDRMADGDDSAVIEADVARSHARISGAPAVIVACMSTADMDHYLDDRRARVEETMATQSVAMAVQNLLLAAYSEGLGACWMCAPLFCPDVVSQVLRLPSDWQPQALVTLGVPANDGKPANRKSIQMLTRWI